MVHVELMLTCVSYIFSVHFLRKQHEAQLNSDGEYKGRRGKEGKTGDEWGRKERKRSVLVNVTRSHLSD